MRDVINFQQQLGEINISDIELNLNSRDDIPNILRGLQHIYCTRPVKEKIFELLERQLTEKQKQRGRQGMLLWRTFVLAVMRTSLSCDYDRLQSLANSHKEVRQILGHDDFSDVYRYPLQTIKDNVSLMTPELLKKINAIVVEAGHDFLGRKEGDHKLQGRADSFVVETNVHYPTDISLLYDAMRKAIKATRKACSSESSSRWRQSQYNIKTIKVAMRKAQQSKRGKSKNRIELIAQAYKDLISLCELYLVSLKESLKDIVDVKFSEKIRNFISHAERQIDQIQRRVIDNETIAASEKVYSIFEPHTEWVNKGKANGVIELGLKVCVLEDQDQFILHHHVMENEVDSQVTERIVRDTKSNFPSLSLCSFDKGFSSALNQEKLEGLLDEVILPKKGKLSKERRETEHTEEFVQARHQHSAVESAINCLGHHGLDKCPDKGITGFKRYVAIAIIGTNLQRLGTVIRKKERAVERRRKRKILRLAA